MKYELEMDYTSPYKATRLYIKDGKAFFGRWKPFDVQIDGDEPEVIVEQGQEGQLDLFAHELYGDRRLWRVIAQANKIDFPLEQVVPKLKLIIPKPEHVQAALLKATARAAVMED